MIRCDCCGRFFRPTPGAMWKMIYSGAIPTPDHEIYRCAPCVERYGPFWSQPEIKAEHSCGPLPVARG